MALLKFKDSEGVWKVLYGALLRNVLRRDKNLSDLPDKDESRKNLGLINNVTTHWHDQYITEENAETKLLELLKGYVKKAGDTMVGALNFANNVWNKVGNDAQIGDRNVAGHICVQGQNGETGIALFQKDSTDNKGTINYDGTQFKFDKPVKITGTTNITGATNISGATTVTGNAKITGTTTMSGNASVGKNLTVTGTIFTTGGFLCENIPVDKLNSYHQKANFIFGSHTDGKNDELGKLISKSSWDYAGLVFGNAISTTTQNMSGCIAQLLCNNGNRLFFRATDGSESGWSAWHPLAHLDEVNNAKSVAAQKLATNGYIKFSNGIVIQWGNGKEPDANNAQWTISFPLSLSAVYSVVSNDSYNGDASYLGTSITGFVQNSAKKYTGCKVRTASYGGNKYYWIAIGKA